MQAPSRIAFPWLAFASAAILASLCAGLGHPLQNLNEGLYARVAQEMLSSGDWIIPTLDGVPYLEKPPLVYWITAGSFAVFGAGEVSARVAPLLGLALTLVAISCFARWRWGAASSWVAAAIAASSPVLVVMGRTLLLDAVFTAALAWSLVLGFEALERGDRRWIRGSLAALALAILAKGLVALPFYAMALAAWCGVSRDAWRQAARILRDPLAVALFAVMVVPWHVAASLREPAFAAFYFVNEHLLRFTGGREPHDYHTGPWWYYLPRLFAYAWPWTLLLIRPAPARDPSDRRLRRFLAAWVLGPLVVFTLAASKADYYLMIAVPALALFAARQLHESPSARGLLMAAGGAVLLWLAAVAAVLAWRGPFTLPWWAGFAALGGATLALGAVALAGRGLRHAAVFAASATAFPLALLYSGFLAANEPVKSARGVAEAVRRMDPAEVYVFRDFEAVSALPFYLARPVRVIDSQSFDLAFGARLRPDSTQFVSSRARLPARSVVVVADRRLREFLATPLAADLASSGRHGSIHLFAARGAGGALVASVAAPAP